jgi:hypothetical protein
MGGGCGHTYAFAQRLDGKTDVDAISCTRGKNLNRRMLGFVLGTIGKGVPQGAFENSVKAIEARSA